MTEAAPQITSNPLPPNIRKPGSAGLPAGPEVAIMDHTGTLLAPGSTGEIVIRGTNVTPGYENNPTANQQAFTNGWFRTGDEGYFDSDGYLYITGRLKEIINRGGKKIAPREVDEVLLQCPGVAQAVTFAIPHPSLAEDVAAAIVVDDEAVVTAQAVREFASTYLADHKVPSQIVIVDEIPKGPTNKLQRNSLADKLASYFKTHFVAPTNKVETAVARIWREVLGIEQVGIHDNFFELGGESLLAVRLFAEIEKLTGKSLPLATLFEAPTIASLAARLNQQGWEASWSSLVAIQPKGARPPLFCIHPIGGNVLHYSDLARRLGPDQPVYGIQPQGLDGV